MFMSKGKERVFSLTGSTITATVISIVLAKDTFSRVEVLDIFSGDRKKFKAYETECRVYFWADGKREDWRNLKIIVEQVIYTFFRLRGEAFARFEPYIT
jgi:hypothetical protein